MKYILLLIAATLGLAWLLQVPSPPSEAAPPVFVVDDHGKVEVPVTAEVKAANTPQFTHADTFTYRQVNGQWQKYVFVPQWVDIEGPPAEVKLAPEPAGHYETRQECIGGRCRRYRVWVPDSSSTEQPRGGCVCNAAGGCLCAYEGACGDGNCGQPYAADFTPRRRWRR